MILITDELAGALRELANAQDFYMKCKAEPGKAAEVGAFKDAHEWIDETVAKVVAALPPEVLARDQG